MKILIVEDNQELAGAVRRAIIDYGIVEIVHTGEDALQVVQDQDFGLVILDLGLPDKPGKQVCSTMRDLGCNMPILIITADEDHRRLVELLDSGADDYVTKPFRSDELKARVRALLRRQESRKLVSNQIILGDLTLHIDQRCVERAGQMIPLRVKEFAILEHLMTHPDMVATRTMLQDKAWDSSEEPWGSSVNVHIKFLRDKIDRPFGSNLIETVHGVGYRISSPQQRKRRTTAK